MTPEIAKFINEKYGAASLGILVTLGAYGASDDYISASYKEFNKLTGTGSGYKPVKRLEPLIRDNLILKTLRYTANRQRVSTYLRLNVPEIKDKR